MDWKLAIFGLQILTILVSLGSFLVLRLNDLTHLSKDVQKLNKNQDGIIKRLTKIEKNQIKIEVIINERTSKK